LHLAEEGLTLAAPSTKHRYSLRSEYAVGRLGCAAGLAGCAPRFVPNRGYPALIPCIFSPT